MRILGFLPPIVAMFAILIVAEVDAFRVEEEPAWLGLGEEPAAPFGDPKFFICSLLNLEVFSQSLSME